MISWALGARFACPLCRRRSSWRACSCCGELGHDLADEQERARFAASWRLWSDHLLGRGLGSARIIPRLRVLRVLAIIAGAGAALAPVVGPLASGKEVYLPIAIGVGVVSFPIAVVMFALMLFIYAHVFRLLAQLLGGGAALLRPLGVRRLRGELGVLTAICRWISQALLPQIELERAIVKPNTSGAREGTDALLDGPLTLYGQRDGSALIAVEDIWLDEPELPLRLRDDGRRLVLQLESATIAIAPELLRRAEVLGPDEAVAPPPWLALSPRAGVRSALRLPADAIVTLSALPDDATPGMRVGSPEHPLHLAFR